MIALGIDAANAKLAIGGVRDDGTLTHHVLALDPKARGARRLVGVRTAAYGVLSGYRSECCAVVVERVWRGSLSDVTIVVSEAAQAALPGAVVMDVDPKSWKREVVGHGNATKPECLAFAQGLGYEGTDQDVADALCAAQCAWERWAKAAARSAA